MAHFLQLCRLNFEATLTLPQVIIECKWSIKNAQNALHQHGDMRQQAVALTPACSNVSLENFELSRSFPQCSHEDSRYLALGLRTQSISNGIIPQNQVNLDRGCVKVKELSHLFLSSGQGMYDWELYEYSHRTYTGRRYNYPMFC